MACYHLHAQIVARDMGCYHLQAQMTTGCPCCGGSEVHKSRGDLHHYLIAKAPGRQLSEEDGIVVAVGRDLLLIGPCVQAHQVGQRWQTLGQPWRGSLVQLDGIGLCRRAGLHIDEHLARYPYPGNAACLEPAEHGCQIDPAQVGILLWGDEVGRQYEGGCSV
jgi:hypothetical protein